MAAIMKTELTQLYQLQQVFLVHQTKFLLMLKICTTNHYPRVSNFSRPA